MVDGIAADRLQEIYIANAVASFFSILGCLFIILMYLMFTDLQKLAFKLIAILAAFDMINALSFLIPTYTSDEGDLICIVQGILMTYSTFGAVIWTSFIAITLYAIVVKSYLQIDSLLKRYLIFNIIAAGILTVIPHLLESNYLTSGFCLLYIGGSEHSYSFRFLSMLIPLWTIIFVNLMLYTSVFRYLRSGKGGEDAKIRKELSKKIGIYPIIIIVCYLPFTIKGAIEFSSWKRNQYEFMFTIMSGAIRSLIGLFNAIAYGLTKKVKNKIYYFVCKNQVEDRCDRLMTEISSRTE